MYNWVGFCCKFAYQKYLQYVTVTVTQFFQPQNIFRCMLRKKLIHLMFFYLSDTFFLICILYVTGSQPLKNMMAR